MIGYGRMDEHGFSLIEVVVSLVIFGILATIFFTYLGSPLQDSAAPLVRLKNTMALQQVMEDIRADFKVNKDLDALKIAIDAGTYGSYIVEHNDYIKFSGNSEVPDVLDHDLLKVRIKNQTDDFSLTLLFAAW